MFEAKLALEFDDDYFLSYSLIDAIFYRLVIYFLMGFNLFTEI